MNQHVRKLISKKGPLAENEVKDLLKRYGIKTTKYKVVVKESDLENLGLKFPVALKVCSNKILHKTDVGGVKLDIKNMDELVKNFREFRKRFAKEKLLVDEMVEKGVEVIIGLVQDPTFGLSIMCGVGGIFTELYQDVTFRVVPIDKYDAEEMLEEIKKVGVDVYAYPSSATSGIENTYYTKDMDRRKTRPIAFAGMFSRKEIPDIEWENFAIVPIIAGEINMSLLKYLRDRTPGDADYRSTTGHSLHQAEPKGLIKVD